MAMKQIGNVTVRSGEYTDGSGAKRGRYQRVGVEYQKDDGSTLLAIEPAFLSSSLLTQMAAAGIDISRPIFLSVYRDEERSKGTTRSGGAQSSAPPQAASKPAQAAGEDFNDDIPF